MPLVFANSNSVVAILMNEQAGCAQGLIRIQVPENPNEPSLVSFKETRCLVLQVETQLPDGVQFQHTGGDLVFVYVFGRRVGQITVKGLAVPCPCPDPTTGEVKSGLDEFFEWVKRNRSSARSQPLTLTVSKQTFDGFLLNADTTIIAAAIPMVNWTLHIGALP